MVKTSKNNKVVKNTPVKKPVPVKKPIPATKFPVKKALAKKVVPVKKAVPTRKITAEDISPIKLFRRNAEMKSISEILSDQGWVQKLDEKKQERFKQLMDVLNQMDVQVRDLSANSLDHNDLHTDDPGDMGNIQYSQDMNLRLIE